MNHADLVLSLELERQDRTFWQLPDPSTRLSASKRNERIAAIAADLLADADDAERHRAQLLAEVGPELVPVSSTPTVMVRHSASPHDEYPRDTEQSESSTSIGAA